MSCNNRFGEWTAAELEIVQVRWAAGESSAQIARRLRNRTRNSVIGIVHRKGWARNGRAPVPKPEPVAKITAVRPRPKPKSGPIAMLSQSKSDASPETRERCAAAGQAKIEAVEVAANDDAIPLMDRGRYQCAWPMGVPARPAQQMCCGQPVRSGVSTALESYCAHHQGVAASRLVRTEKELVRSVRRFA